MMAPGYLRDRLPAIPWQARGRHGGGQVKGGVAAQNLLEQAAERGAGVGA
jgi:hypothetical protein